MRRAWISGLQPRVLSLDICTWNSVYRERGLDASPRFERYVQALLANLFDTPVAQSPAHNTSVYLTAGGSFQNQLGFITGNFNRGKRAPLSRHGPAFKSLCISSEFWHPE